MITIPKPDHHHKNLLRLVGNWRGEETVYPSPWDPKGGPATGIVNNRAALDGFVVVQEYEQIRNGSSNFRGHGIFGHDASEQCYTLHWFDSMGMPPTLFKGDYTDHVLTLVNRNPQGHTRATFNLREEKKYHFKMEVSQDGKSWYTFTEGSYTIES